MSKRVTELHAWILLVHQLPQKPTKLRVRMWRKLQALGSISIKNSVYVLPSNNKTDEDFQWLSQEIESLGGEVNLFRAGSVEGATDKEIIDLFQKVRDEDYSKLIAEFQSLTGAVREQMKGGSLSVGRLAQYEAEISRLRAELERIRAIDFFGAPLGDRARAAFDRCSRVLQATESRTGRSPSAGSGGARMKMANYQNRRWVTRRDPHIDRLASAWLIRRFIDKRPRFLFITEGETMERALAFDMTGGDFTHQGEDCTFETMIKYFGLTADRGLSEIAEIVHDIDLKDNKFKRPEGAGINSLIKGLSSLYADDNERLKVSLPVFDALYESLNQQRARHGANQRHRDKPGRDRRGRKQRPAKTRNKDKTDDR